MSRKRKKKQQKRQKSAASPGGVFSRKHQSGRKKGTSSRAAAPPSAMMQELERAAARHRQGDLAGARAAYDDLLARGCPGADLRHLRGVLAQQEGEAAVAVRFIEEAVRLAPRQPLFFFNLGIARAGLGDAAGARSAYEESIRLGPDQIPARRNLALLLRNSGDREGAARELEKILERQPRDARALMGLGDIRLEQGRSEEALELFEKAALAPPPPGPDANTALPWLRMAQAYRRMKRLDEACKAYEDALSRRPDWPVALNNLGNLLLEQGRGDEAISRYDQAVAADPDYFFGHFNRANALQGAGRLDEALAAYDRAIALDPEQAEVWLNRAAALSRLGRRGEAVEGLRRARELAPENLKIRSALVHQLQYLCAWDDLAPEAAFLDDAIAKAVEKGAAQDVVPFEHIVRVDDPHLNLTVARWASHRIRAAASGLLPGGFSHAAPAEKKPILTVGYVSADFGNHPVGHLISGLFGRHDRQRFRIHCYSHGPEDATAYRRRIREQCDRFVDIRRMSHADAARTIHNDGVDILVDLMGHTLNARLEIFALRPAPVQISFLGYPGSTGADFMDYLVVDPLIAPQNQLDCFSERLIFLPDTYQVNDGAQGPSDRAFTRAELGLPETGFVFCSFNQRYKIDPAIFACWMNILTAVPGSVLWLLDAEGAANRNLREQVQRAGVDPARLIFAEKIGKADHLARHRLADLALDTRIVNGHTTTSDALFAGTPVLTVAGRHFASRVAASLLTAAGLPDLVCLHPAEYERRAVEFATQPEKLRVVKDRLAAARRSAPLFDTARFVRSLETAFQAAWQIRVQGERPRHIRITANTGLPGAAGSAAVPPGPALQARIREAFAHHQAGRRDEAARIYEEILADQPDQPDALHLSGLIAHELGDSRKGAERISRALALQPATAIFHRNMAAVQQALGREDLVREHCRKAIELKPDFAEAWNSLGMACKRAGSPKEAIAHFEKAVSLRPDMVEPLNNLGNVNAEIRDFAAAVDWFEKALAIRPDSAEVYNNLGAAHKEKGDLDKAQAAYEKALEIKPDFAEALSNLGSVFRERGDLDRTVDCFQKALKLKPSLQTVHNDLFFILRQLCRWEEADEVAAMLDRMSDGLLAGGRRTVESPFSNLVRHADILRNGAVAASWARHIEASVSGERPIFSFEGRLKPRERLRIGYISNDFRNHAVSHLIVGLFACHDRSKVEIYCYSHGPDDGSGYRRKIARDCDAFVDLHELNHAAAARRIYDDGVDILIDLMGFTKGHRLQVAALRPAPVQINFLGFPGTTGAGFFDYMITDSTVTPEGHMPHYREKLVFMPHCYQVNDRNQPVSDRQWTRAEFGLPETGFIFCSFNQSYKIEPVMFGVWMQILTAVPGSVLWLLKRDDDTSARLREAAEAAGVSGDRLIFADRMVKHEHLARHKLADLALDTRVVNGHTTTSDALWAGVPLLTRIGTHFASRVAASILSTAGLPELITASEEEYARTAIRLAQNPEELARLREKVRASRTASPLFDTRRFARSLEGAFQVMWNARVTGKGARHIRLEERLPGGADTPQRVIPEPAPMVGAVPLRTPAGWGAPGAAGLSSELRQALGKGVQLQRQGKLNEAVAAYKAAAEIDPDHIMPWGNLGNIYQSLGKLDEAEAAYRRVLEIKPDSAEAYNNLGNVFEGKKDVKQAIANYRKAVELKPDFAQAYNNMGVVYRAANQMGEAMKAYEKAIEINPGLDKTYNSLIYLYQQFCLWDKVAETAPKMDELTAASLEKGQKPGESPFTNLTRTADPEINFRVARAWSRAMEASAGNLLEPFDFSARKGRPEKIITVGYLSNDFRNHAVAHLISGMFSLHDRSRFRIHAYSHGVNDKSKYRDQVANGCDLFADIRTLDREAAARKIFDDGVDILVDLMGYTKDNKLDVCALRPAPIQVEFLGFPGTTGAKFFDYVITDRTITPPAHQEFYAEKPVWMPHCYQVNDGRQTIAETKYTRRDQNLPEEGVVFCSFNQPYKIDALQFDMWMRILQRVPGSVLWLLLRSSAGGKRLQQEAKARGVDPARLIIADVKPKDEHLARHALADLGLDTRIVNGHTTTSDALWAGVPVLTLLGRHFASRVAASILEAAGLPELVARTIEAYEETAVDLALHPEKLAAIRARLWENRRTYPLFDTARYARNLEKAYAEMWDSFTWDRPPAPISVADVDPPLVEKRGEVNTEAEDIHVRLQYDTARVTGDIALGPQRLDMQKTQKQMSLKQALKLALEHHQAGRLEEGEGIYRQILAAKPDYPDAQHLLGVLCHQTGRHQGAVDLIRKAIEANPAHPLYRGNLGAAYQGMGDMRAALACYEEAVRLHPNHPEALMNMGSVLKTLGRYGEGVKAYEAALKVKPDFGEARSALGVLLSRLGRMDEALPHFEAALRQKPDSPELRYQAAQCHPDVETRISWLRQVVDETADRKVNSALAQAATRSKAAASLLHQYRQICQWDAAEGLLPLVESLTEADIQAGRKTGEQPLMHLMRCTDPAKNLVVARTWAVHAALPARLSGRKFDCAPARRSREAGGKIRIGYVSGDFRNHPVAHLIRSFFSLHNRKEFEIYAYSFGTDDGSGYRRKIMADVDHFIDIRSMSNEEAAVRIHEDGIHILVDLAGHTGGENRLGIFAFRPSERQITWLGYPGTTGAGYMDFLIADRIVVPEAEREHYAEKILYPPHTYQATDWRQPISDREYVRAEAGLPEQGVVYCSFNQFYKIGPDVFACWMRILRQVEGSVLWLFGSEKAGRRNLRKAAEGQGVDSSRLVFAERLPKEEHLARHRLADICLDTMTVNGHTTTTDALWAGVPVIAMRGRHFASRVAGSLLGAAGLPELITEDVVAYERLAVDLGRDAARRRFFRQKLLAGKMDAPLFDTLVFVESVEDLFRDILVKR
ncbi:MAG: hypothetical protein CSB33_04150, partial [Desulfobacterales bacterium]